MSMLAEPRRRQKYSSDPRGLHWANDDNKFGQKLMEKMGWQKGKGLGSKENGRLNHVTTAVKKDTRGIGCTKNHADNWIAHQQDFDSLLSELNQFQNSETDTQMVKLEEKSKMSRARVHYQKFIKGKDLSKANEDDLASIFGKRKKEQCSDSHTVSQKTEETHQESVRDEDTKTYKMYGITTVHSGISIADYFASKMAEMKAKTNGMENEPKHLQNDEECEHGELMEDQIEITERKKKKKKYHDLSPASDARLDNVDENSGDLRKRHKGITDKSSQKRSKEKRDLSSDGDDQLNEEDEMLKNCDQVLEVNQEPKDESVKTSKKKKKKAKDLTTSEASEVQSDDGEVNRQQVDSSLCTSGDSCTKTSDRKKKHKKKRKSRTVSPSPVNNIQTEECENKSFEKRVFLSDSDTNEGEVRKHRKKHKKRTDAGDLTCVTVSKEMDSFNEEKSNKMGILKEYGNSHTDGEKNSNDKVTMYGKHNLVKCQDDKGMSCKAKPVDVRTDILKRKVSKVVTNLFPGSNFCDIPGYRRK